MPARKKDPTARARVNRASTARTLSVGTKVAAPDLPEREWHPLTLAWWADVWASPMAAEFLTVDVHRLVMIAALVDDFWVAGSPSARRDAATEVRLQSVAFGLTPYDRRRLEWTIEQTDEARDRGRQRRERQGVKQPTPCKDPRRALRAV